MKTVSFEYKIPQLLLSLKVDAEVSEGIADRRGGWQEAHEPRVEELTIDVWDADKEEHVELTDIEGQKVLHEIYIERPRPDLLWLSAVNGPVWPKQLQPSIAMPSACWVNRLMGDFSFRDGIVRERISVLQDIKNKVINEAGLDYQPERE